MYFRLGLYNADGSVIFEAQFDHRQKYVHQFDHPLVESDHLLHGVEVKPDLEFLLKTPERKQS